MSRSNMAVTVLKSVIYSELMRNLFSSPSSWCVCQFRHFREGVTIEYNPQPFREHAPTFRSVAGRMVPTVA